MTHAHPGPSVLMATGALCDKDSGAKGPTYLIPLHWKAVSLEILKGLPPAKGSGGVDFRREGWAPLGRVHHKPTPPGNPPTREPWMFQGAAWLGRCLPITELQSRWPITHLQLRQGSANLGNDQRAHITGSAGLLQHLRAVAVMPERPQITYRQTGTAGLQ